MYSPEWLALRRQLNGWKGEQDALYSPNPKMRDYRCDRYDRRFRLRHRIAAMIFPEGEDED